MKAPSDGLRSLPPVPAKKYRADTDDRKKKAPAKAPMKKGSAPC